MGMESLKSTTQFENVLRKNIFSITLKRYHTSINTRIVDKTIIIVIIINITIT